MDIYSKLFDIVDDNMKTAGKQFQYKKNTFLHNINRDPQVVDVADFLSLSNEDFFQAVFVASYKRLPEERELAEWEAKFTNEKEAFQKEFLSHISRGSAVAINQIKFINNPYFKQSRGVKYFLLGKLYGLTDKSSLRVFGKTLPKPIQKIIRRIFL